MKVIFAPDYRRGNPYQELLAEALQSKGVHVSYLSHLRRGLPLTRGLGAFGADLLHLHWPEYYYRRRKRTDPFRLLRYPVDLTLATRKLPLVVTIHDLHPHNTGTNVLARSAVNYTLKRADALIAHSESARALIPEVYHVDQTRMDVIAHGDLSARAGAMPARDSASRVLGTAGPICLMFGNMEPYKGIEEVLLSWTRLGLTTRLVLVGQPLSAAYEKRLRELASTSKCVTIVPERQSNEGLKLWLAASDCIIFNYRKVLTSGAASLARSLGIPIIVPSRLKTLDLMEPHPRVFRFERFDEGFTRILRRAIGIGVRYDSANEYRTYGDWTSIAERTAAVYKRVIESSPKQQSGRVFAKREANV